MDNLASVKLLTDIRDDTTISSTKMDEVVTAVEASNVLLTSIDADTGSMDGKLTTSNTYLNSIATYTSSVFTQVTKAADVVVYNVTMTNANTEYTQSLPSSTNNFFISIQGGVGANSYRIAWVTGKVATPTAPYLTYPDNVEYGVDNVILSSKTLYLAGSAAGMVVQIVAYY